MTTYTPPAEAVEAAAIEICGHGKNAFYEYPYNESAREDFRAKARAALTAAGPIIEQAARERAMSDIREALVALIRGEYDVTERGEDQWWESLVEVACDEGHRIFIDDGDGGVYACPACALPPTVKPSVEDVARALFERAVKAGDAIPHRSVFEADAHAVIALLPGRTEADVKAEGWDEGAQAGLDVGLTIAENVHANGGVLDLASVPGPPANPYRKG